MSQILNKAHVTKPAPVFKATALMPDKSFKEISLSDYKGKYLVLFFYPLDFTFVCPTEIIEFANRADEFRKIGCEVLGASVDSQYSHLAWTEQPRNKGGLGQINCPILSDLSREIAQNYGVLLDGGHSLRGTFIIDRKGIIRHCSFNDPPVGRNVSETLRLVQAYQYADEHGEVCPSGWMPGKATINPQDKDSYFSKHGDGYQEKMEH